MMRILYDVRFDKIASPIYDGKEENLPVTVCFKLVFGI